MSEPSTPIVACVVVAAGRGERFGDGGKVLADCAGRPLLAWSLDALEAAGTVRDVVIVYGAHTEAEIRSLVAGERNHWPKVTALTPGGVDRHASVQAGIAVLAADVEIVLIHDAARPLATAAQHDAVANAAVKDGAAILAIPVADTLKRVSPEMTIEETIPREHMWAAQTPQGFRVAAYREALAQTATATTGRSNPFTDDASLFEALGWSVAIVPGSRVNVKVTVPEDLQLVTALLGTRMGGSS